MDSNYDSFAETFGNSRKNLFWPEISYFLQHIDPSKSILDLGCGNGRFLTAYESHFGAPPESYIGLDSSEKLLTQANNSFPNQDFIHADMRHVEDTLAPYGMLDEILAIASFHHLETLDDRQSVLSQLFRLLAPGGRLFMTHWALESPINLQKYASSRQTESQNEFGSSDFLIKIGSHERFYHSFHPDELEFLAKDAGFDIITGTLFSGEKNYISIWQKPKSSPTKII